MTAKQLSDAIARGFMAALVAVAILAVTLAFGGVTFSHH
jgi:hypothetical protein